MVQVNEANRSIVVELESCGVEQLTNMQNALIDLIGGYRYEDFGAGVSDTISSAMDLLTALLPNAEQQKRALSNETDFVKLPKNMNQRQRDTLYKALFMIDNQTDIDPKNEVYKSLSNIKSI